MVKLKLHGVIQLFRWAPPRTWWFHRWTRLFSWWGSGTCARSSAGSRRHPRTHLCRWSYALYAHSLCNASTHSTNRSRRNTWFSSKGALNRIFPKNFLHYSQSTPPDLCVDIDSLYTIIKSKICSYLVSWSFWWVVWHQGRNTCGTSGTSRYLRSSSPSGSSGRTCDRIEEFLVFYLYRCNDRSRWGKLYPWFMFVVKVWTK